MELWGEESSSELLPLLQSELFENFYIYAGKEQDELGRVFGGIYYKDDSPNVTIEEDMETITQDSGVGNDDFYKSVTDKLEETGKEE